MKYLIYTLGMLLSAYVISVIVSFLVDRKKEISFDSRVMSKDSTAIIKGFAILIIMLAHIGNDFGIRYLTPLGSLGVAIFLLCSGFGLEKSFQKNGLRGFWKKRIITAYLPYLVFEIIGYVFLYQGITFKTVLLDLLLIDTIHPYGWYMSCLFLYYIAFWISSLISKKNPIIKYVVLSVCALLMFVFLRSLFKQQLLSFIIGALMANFEERICPYFKKASTSLIFLGIGLSALLLRQLDAVRNLHVLIYSMTEVIQCTSLAIGCVSLITIIILKLKHCFYLPITYVGLISFELYLIHAFFIPEKMTVINIFLFYVLSFVVSAFVYLVKRYISVLLKKRVIYVKKN